MAPKKTRICHNSLPLWNLQFFFNVKLFFLRQNKVESFPLTIQYIHKIQILGEKLPGKKGKREREGGKKGRE